MKAVCLASAMTIVLLVAVTVAFRLAPREQRVRQIGLLYLASTAALIAVWLSTPDDLGFLQPWLLAGPPWFDLLLAMFFFAAAFFGGVAQLYNLADRGFSLRILIDALEDPNGSVDVDRLIAHYGGGQGITWMYDKRVRGLLDGDFIQPADHSFTLTGRGARIADIFIHIRKLLRLDPS